MKKPRFTDNQIIGSLKCIKTGNVIGNFNLDPRESRWIFTVFRTCNARSNTDYHWHGKQWRFVAIMGQNI